MIPSSETSSRPTFPQDLPTERPKCFGSYTCIEPGFSKCMKCLDRKPCVDVSKVKLSKVIGSATFRIKKDGKIYVKANIDGKQVLATVSIHEKP